MFVLQVLADRSYYRMIAFAGFVVSVALFAVVTGASSQNLEFSGFEVNGLLVDGATTDMSETGRLGNIALEIFRVTGPGEADGNKVVFFSVGPGAVSRELVTTPYLPTGKPEALMPFVQSKMDGSVCNFKTISYSNRPIVYWLVVDTEQVQTELVDLCIIYNFARAFGFDVPLPNATTASDAMAALNSLIKGKADE